MVHRYDYFGKTESFEPFDRGEWVKYEDYAALRKIASMLVENLSDGAKLPCETVELMKDLGVFDD